MPPTRAATVVPEVLERMGGRQSSRARSEVWPCLSTGHRGDTRGEACVFALEFTTQPIWQRMTFRGLEGGKVDPGPAQLRLDVTDILGKQESLDPIDKACAFPDKTLTLPMRAAKALCSGLSSGCW